MYKTLKIWLLILLLSASMASVSASMDSADPFYLREMHWGQPVSDMPGLRYVGCDLEYSFYRKQGDELRIPIGNDTLTANDIIYTFNHGQLAEITIVLGYTQGETVVGWLTFRYGEGLRYDLVMGWRWVWLGEDTINDIFLGEHQAVWKIRSRALLQNQLKREGFTLEQIYPRH